MPERSDDRRRVSRRTLLCAGVAASTARLARGATTQPEIGETVPMRPLGKTGVSVTRLAMGGSFAEYGPRLLEHAFRSGIRYFDMGDFYAGFKAEIRLGEWIAATKRRNDVFVVNKARTTDPEECRRRLDEALAKMKLETIDLFLLHGLEDPDVSLDRPGTWKRLKADLIRRKKIRFMGFSTHAEMPQRVACLANAAKGGWADAVMVACDPGLIRGSPQLNRALDACASAGIGLVAMKTGRGLGRHADQPEAAREAFARLGFSPHVAMLAGIWSDERFASVCSEMPSFEIIRENTEAAKSFRKPFSVEQWRMLDEAMRKVSRATCPGCDGSCRRAGGTKAALCEITRYLAYCRESGNRAMARELYARLSAEQRDWSGADLAAAEEACGAHLDFHRLLPLAERLLS